MFSTRCSEEGHGSAKWSPFGSPTYDWLKRKTLMSERHHDWRKTRGSDTLLVAAVLLPARVDGDNHFLPIKLESLLMLFC